MLVLSISSLFVDLVLAYLKRLRMRYHLIFVPYPLSLNSITEAIWLKAQAELVWFNFGHCPLSSPLNDFP